LPVHRRVLQPVVATVAVLAATVLIGRPASATPVPPFYLAIGASESLGVQPTVGAPHEHPTSDGYANDVLAMEATRWPGLQLVQVGCPGLTLPHALEGGGRCAYRQHSELGDAVSFLQAHRTSTVLVTLDLEFNDLLPCIEHRVVDEHCVTRSIGVIRSLLPRFLAALVAAGNPETHIVGLEHNDPDLVLERFSRTERFATNSETVLAELNQTLGNLYAQAGALTADVPSRFEGTADEGGAFGPPTARSCLLTWMCAKPPFGPNLHPTDAGYRLIADGIATALDRALGSPRATG
jgi:hypothetical protein